MASRRNAGFTLVELILVILVLGIIATSSVGFIKHSVLGYSDLAKRQRLAAEASLVQQQLRQQFAYSLPGSLAQQGNCLSYTPVVGLGFVGEPLQATPLAQLFNPTEQINQQSLALSLAKPVSLCWQRGSLYRSAQSELNSWQPSSDDRLLSRDLQQPPWQQQDGQWLLKLSWLRDEQPLQLVEPIAIGTALELVQ